MSTVVPENADSPREFEGAAAAALPPIIVMGVSGAGKSTIGSLVAGLLGVPFIDGDDLHPEANRSKMAAGIPLDDGDRAPWLALIGQTIATRLAAGEPVVLACSALKRAYRDALRAAVPSLVFALPTGDPEVLVRRLAVRQHEFMPRTLLDSQLATLEPLGPDEAHVEVDFADAPDESARQIVGLVRELVAQSR